MKQFFHNFGVYWQSEERTWPDTAIKSMAYKQVHSEAISWNFNIDKSCHCQRQIRLELDFLQFAQDIQGATGDSAEGAEHAGSS